MILNLKRRLAVWDMWFPLMAFDLTRYKFYHVICSDVDWFCTVANKEMTGCLRKYCSVVRVLIKYNDIFLDFF